MILNNLSALEHLENQSSNEILRAELKTNLEKLMLIAHELRSPLASLHCLLDDSSLSDLERRGIREQLQRIERISRDLLVENKGSLNEMQFHMLGFELNPFLKKFVVSTKKIIPNPLEFDIQDQNQSVVWDPIRIEQMLLNMISNASKYSSAEKKIELNCKIQGDDIVIEVKDLGTGIGSAPLKTGNGLGLKIVSEILRAHKGRLAVESEMGVGTTIRAIIPSCPHLS